MVTPTRRHLEDSTPLIPLLEIKLPTHRTFRGQARAKPWLSLALKEIKETGRKNGSILLTFLEMVITADAQHPAREALRLSYSPFRVKSERTLEH